MKTPLFHGLRWKITCGIVLIVIMAVSTLWFFTRSRADDEYISSHRASLETDTRVACRMISSQISFNRASLESTFRECLPCRVVILDRQGRVISDSDPGRNERVNWLDIAHSAKLATGYDRDCLWFRDTNHIYAVRNLPAASHSGTVIASENLLYLDTILGRIDRLFLRIGLLGVLLALLLGLSISGSLCKAISTMEIGIRRFSDGELAYRMQEPFEPGNELDIVIGDLNMMARNLHSRLEELTDEKGMLETILSRTDDGLVVTDSESMISMLNPAAGRILGASLDKVQGKTVIEGTGSTDLSDLVSRVFRTRAPASLEISLSTQGGASMNVYVAPLERSGEVLTGAIIVMHDLSAAKKIDSVRRDFIANVSHELRTPLASMRVMAETIMIRGRKDPDAAEKFAGKIISEADRLAALSDDLLDLARIESGGKSIHQEIIPLAKIAEQVAAEYILVAAKKGVDLSVVIPSDISIRADRDSVVQILMNLIDNAVKYTAKGGSVRVSAELKGKTVFTRVADTGSGIPSEDLARIFERFYRVDKARSRASGGTGLGLSIVKHLVEANEGRVMVESASGAGSTFTFTMHAA